MRHNRQPVIDFVESIESKPRAIDKITMESMHVKAPTYCLIVNDVLRNIFEKSITNGVDAVDNNVTRDILTKEYANITVRLAK
jgi:hypothetical protein